MLTLEKNRQCIKPRYIRYLFRLWGFIIVCSLWEKSLAKNSPSSLLSRANLLLGYGEPSYATSLNVFLMINKVY